MSLTALVSTISTVAPILSKASSGLKGILSPADEQGQFSQVLAKISQEGNSQEELSLGRQISPFKIADAGSAVMENIQGKEGFRAGRQLLEFFIELKKENRSLGKIEASQDDLLQLEELLLNSGYSQEQAEALLDKSLNSEGQLDLDTLAGFIVANPPQGGTSFLLDSVDKPLLVQVLQDVGLSPSEIDNYLGQASQQGDKLLLRGISELLARVEETPLSKENLVDSSRLTSLLSKLGLEKPEIEALLRQSQEQEPGVNAKALTMLLEQAAQKQNRQLTQMLREIIAKGAPEAQPEMSSGMILRAKMIKSQQFVEKRVEQTADPGQSRAQAVPGSGESPGLEASPSAAAALADKAEARASLQPGHSGAEPEPGRQGKEQGARKSAEARVLSAAGGVESVAKGGGSLAAGSRTSLLPAYVVRQVALGMERMTAQNLDHLSLSLKPPSLGEISMDLAVKDGAVKASLVAETVAAKKALEAGLDSLKQHLAGQGIKVQQIEISVQPDAQRRQERAQDGEKQNRRPRREQTEASAETEAANSAFLNGRLSVHA